VFTSADLIEALRKRGRRSLRPDAPTGEFPPGWQAWLDALTTRLGAVTGAAADAFVALFLERELALPPPRMAALTRWQAFATLWRQQWQPPAPEERRMRLLAMTITLAIHLVLLVLLIWIAFVRFTGEPPPAAEEVVQVEFIGRGTPEQNGGAPPSPQERPARPAHAPQPTRAERAPARPVATPAPAPAPRAAATTPTPPPEATAPAPAPAAPSQPLQVSNVPEPTTTFVLPPPTARTAEVPQVQAPTLQVAPREVPMIERAQPIEAARPQLSAPELRAPALQPEVAPTLPEVQLRTVEVPVLRTPTLQAQPREVPLREPTPTPAAAAAAPANAAPAPVATVAAPKAAAPSPAPAPGTPAAKPANATAAAPAAPSTLPGTSTGTAPGARAPTGTGPGAATPGAWPSPVPNDEWGNAPRNRPGATAGTPGAEIGRPGVPPGTPGAAPPGSVTEHVDLDHAGKWLKRPPIGYTPTRFDKFWTPSETLLEEWVRKNIRSVEIPIPGTGKHVHCVISILQLGGGCGIEDPNMQDQEAEFRKPPDVPFKPELQEDQGALRKQDTP
jgi:hypothetical protein